MTTPVHTIRATLNVPRHGHAHITAPVSNRIPQTVAIGPRGVIGRPLFPIGRSHWLWEFEGIWELFGQPLDDDKLDAPGEGRPGTRKLTIDLEVPETQVEGAESPFIYHDSVSDRIYELFPIGSRVTFSGERTVVNDQPLKLVDFKLIEKESTGGMRRYRTLLEAGDIHVAMFHTIWSRSPAVDVRQVVKHAKGDSGRLTIRQAFGEPVFVRRWDDGFGTEVRTHPQDRKAFEWSTELDTAEHADIDFAILCESHDYDLDALDEFSHAANDAAKHGPFYGQTEFQPHERFMGARVLATMNSAELAERITGKFVAGGDRPAVPAKHPHASGNQDGFGLAIPWLRGQDPRFGNALLWNAQDWLRRPSAYYEPNAGWVPVRSHARPHFYTKTRRPFEARHNRDFHFELIGMPFTPLESRLRARKPIDDEHCAGTALNLAYAMTGDPVLKMIVELHAQLDIAQVQHKLLDSAGTGRAVGRVLNELAQQWWILDEPHRSRLQHHATRILHNADRKQQAQGGPLGLTHRQEQCVIPSVTPYEEALASWGAYMWREIGSWVPDEFLMDVAEDVANRASLVALRPLYVDSGRIEVPYRYTHEFPADVVLSSGSDYIHPGNYVAWTVAAAVVREQLLGEAGDTDLTRNLRAQARTTAWTRASDIASAFVTG